MWPMRARPSRADLALGAGRLPELAPRMAPASDLGPDVDLAVVGRVVGLSEEHVVDALGVGLDVARVAREHLEERGAGLLAAHTRRRRGRGRRSGRSNGCGGTAGACRPAGARAGPRCRWRRWRCRRRCCQASARAAATTVAPAVAPASSTHRLMVPRSSGKPSRASRSSMRWSGSPSQNFSAMMCASIDGAASERGKSSGGIGVVSIIDSPWRVDGAVLRASLDEQRARRRAARRPCSSPRSRCARPSPPRPASRRGRRAARDAPPEACRSRRSRRPVGLRFAGGRLAGLGLAGQRATEPVELRRGWPRTPSRAGRCPPARPWPRRCAAAGARAPAAAARAKP